MRTLDPHTAGMRVSPSQRLRARGFRWLFLCDAVGLFAVMVGINLVRFGLHWPTYPLAHYMIGFSIATVIHVSIGYLAGLHEREPLLGQRAWLPRVMLAMAIGVAVDAIAFVVLDRYLMPRLNLFALWLIGSVVLTGNRQLSRWLMTRHRGPSQVLLVGRAGARERALRHLDSHHSGATVVAVADDPATLAAAVELHGVTDVLLLDEQAFVNVRPEQWVELDRHGVGIMQRIGARDTLLGLQAVREVAGMPFVRLHTQSLASHNAHLKRGLDLLTVVATAPLTLPTIALTALYVRVRAGSPVFYRQVRTGRDGVPFRLVKFRTMSLDAEAAGSAMLASENDPRVVPGLGWLRATRLDELPQLWNVVRGDM
ncbi:MAG: sugar transferase, partial [Actinomycetota bacterium]